MESPHDFPNGSHKQPIGWLLPVVGSVLVAAAVAGTVWVLSPDRAGSGQDGGSLIPPGSLHEELAIGVLTGGGGIRDRGAGSIDALLALARSPEEAALIRLLATGNDQDALRAVAGLSALGGNAMAILAAILKDTGWPDEVRAAAAVALMEGGDDKQARGAMRGLALIGGSVATDQLTAILQDTDWPEALRIQSALELGRVGTPAALDALVGAFSEFSDPSVQEDLLDSLGHFPFRDIEPTIREFLESPGTPPELRVAAADALSNSSRDALPYLKSLVAGDTDPDVREMAAWAMSMLDDAGPYGDELAGLARNESEADVRRRIYEALSTQSKNTAPELVDRITAETDIAARIAGSYALADAIRRGDSPALTSAFNSVFVPELQRVANSDASMNLRLRSIFSLERANTPEARAALGALAGSTNARVAKAARRALGP